MDKPANPSKADGPAEVAANHRQASSATVYLVDLAHQGEAPNAFRLLDKITLWRGERSQLCIFFHLRLVHLVRADLFVHLDVGGQGFLGKVLWHTGHFFIILLLDPFFDLGFEGGTIFEQLFERRRGQLKELAW